MHGSLAAAALLPRGCLKPQHRLLLLLLPPACCWVRPAELAWIRPQVVWRVCCRHSTKAL